MTIDPGPRPTGSPRAESIQQYDKQAKEFSHIIALGGMDPGPIPLIIGGLHLIDIDLVSILTKASRAELEDPVPQCSAPIGPRHCVKRWRHRDAHWVEEE